MNKNICSAAFKSRGSAVAVALFNLIHYVIVDKENKMSVWQEPTFRTTVPRLLYEALGDLAFEVARPIYKEKIGNTKGLVRGPSDMTYLEAWTSGDLIDLDWKEPDFPDVALAERLKECSKVMAGTRALYYLFYANSRGDFKWKQQFPYDKIAKCMVEAVRVVGPSTMVNPNVWNHLMWEHVKDPSQVVTQLEDFAESVKYIQKVTSSKARKYAAEDPWEDRALRLEDIAEDALWEVINVNGMYLWFGVGLYNGVVAVLSTTHMQQLYKTASAFAAQLEYIEKSYDRSAKDASIAMFSQICQSMAKCEAPLCYSIAKAYHKLNAILLGRILGQLVPNADETLLAEYVSDNLDHIVVPDDFFNIVNKLTIKERIEVAKFYKALPSPDFDPATALASIHDKHSTFYPTGDTATQGGDEIVLLYKRIRVRNFLDTYFRLRGEYPGTCNNPRDAMVNAIAEKRWLPPTYEECDSWDLTGVLQYIQYGTDYAHLLNDKVLAPPSKKYFDFNISLRNAPRHERSTLWHLLEAPSRVNTVEALDKWNQGVVTFDNIVQVAWKAESHKPDSRIFYMAPITPRILNSELEDGIAYMLKARKGNYMGVDPIELSKHMARTMNPNLYPDKSTVLGKPVIISYDLEAFSTRLPPSVMKDNVDFWATIYGKPAIKILEKCTIGVDICQQKEGFCGSYKMPGGDLEGFRGRMNTWFHIDVMATAYERAKQAGIIQLPGELGVFIDDGIAKITVNGEGRVWIDNVMKLRDIIIETYAALGLRLHKYKTIFSAVGGVMLNEIYYKGVRVSPGIRAYARVSPDFDNPVTAFSEDLDDLFAKVQGAVKSGTNLKVAYAKYLREVCKSLARWTGYRKSPHFAHPLKVGLMFYTPRGLGGFGIANMQQLASTISAVNTAEGIGVLRTFARTYPMYKETVTRILKQPLVIQDKLSLLRNPLRVRRTAPVLRENVATVFILEYLKRNAHSLNSEMRKIFEVDLQAHATKVAEVVFSQLSVNLVVVKKMWNITPLAYAERIVSKFKRASTLIEALGRYKIGGIRRSNQNNLRDVLSNYPLA